MEMRSFKNFSEQVFQLNMTDDLTKQIDKLLFNYFFFATRLLANLEQNLFSTSGSKSD